MYGMIPKAKTAALLNAPPVNIFINPNKSVGLVEAEFFSTDGITPGNTT